MRRIVRTASGWGVLDGEHVRPLVHDLGDVLAGAPLETSDAALPRGPLLAPVDEQEVWAAGVTYRRSLVARTEESQEPDVYERVYGAERPELFFKSVGQRVLGPDGEARVRSDSTWDVPEAEVVLVIDARGEVFGYTIGDDVSSRSIEGDNPLYLPQAKVYEGSCVLGPWIVPASDVAPPFDVSMTISRGGRTVFTGSTSTAEMRRGFDELASWLVRAMTFPRGVMLMTGTGIVPDETVTLRGGDRVSIAVSGIGTLEHEVSLWPC